MSESEDKMAPHKLFDGVVKTLRDTYGSMVSVSQVESWLMDQGFRSRDAVARFSDQPSIEFVKEGIPLVFKVQRSRTITQEDSFATLIANTTKDYAENFLGYVPLN